MSELPGPRFDELTAGVWRAVVEPHGVSIGLIAGPAGAVVVDCGSTPAQGAAIRRAAEECTGVPVIAAVVTHAHHDHLFGLAAFDDVRTIGHEHIADRLGEPGLTAEAERLGVAMPDRRAPNAPLAVVAALDLGDGFRVEILHCGRGHTDTDVVVLVPSADVVFVGDLAEQASPVSFGPDSWPGEWAATLDGVIGLATPRTTCVVGHGEPLTREELIRTRSEVAAVAYEIADLIGRGVAAGDAYEQGNWPYPQEFVAGGIAAEYARAEGRPVRSGRTSLPLA